jgi:hypothetical protein
VISVIGACAAPGAADAGAGLELHPDPHMGHAPSCFSACSQRPR